MLEFFIQPFNLQPPPPARGGGLLKPPSRSPPFSSPPSPNYDGACPPLRESHAAHSAKSSAVRTGVSGQAVSVRALRPCRCGVWHGPPGPPTLIVREQATKHRPWSCFGERRCETKTSSCLHGADWAEHRTCTRYSNYSYSHLRVSATQPPLATAVLRLLALWRRRR